MSIYLIFKKENRSIDACVSNIRDFYFSNNCVITAFLLLALRVVREKGRKRKGGMGKEKSIVLTLNRATALLAHNNAVIRRTDFKSEREAGLP